MKQYLLAVQHVEGAPAPVSPPGAVEAVNEEMRAQGVWMFGGGLLPVSDASVVRQDGDEVLITDGPFAEAKEYMAGFWVIRSPDLEAAHGWAAKATAACGVPIEVRPFDDEVD